MSLFYQYFNYNTTTSLFLSKKKMFIFFLLICIFLGFFLFTLLLQTPPIKLVSSSNGPSSYPIIGCLPSFYKNRFRLLDWYTDLLSFSPTLTIAVSRLGARRIIVTANPANVQHVLKSNFVNFPKGQPFTEILGDLLGSGIFNVDGELWSTQRKLASHEFSTKSLREFVVKTLREEVENRLIPLLNEAADKQQVIDLQDVLRRFAFDIVCRVSLGTDPFCLDFSRPIPPLVQAFDTASMISAMRGAAPVYAVWKVKRMLNLGHEKKLKEAIKLVHTSVMEIVQKKKMQLENGEDEEEGDLLSRLLTAGHDEEVIRDMVISFIMAGRDTTSAAMTWLFWLLSKNKNAEGMILDEVNSLINNGERAIDFELLKEMNFLKASLCESMRLYPPVAWDSKHALADDILPDGTFVCKGDRVTYFPYGMGRMEKLWGKDRLEFKPDRWLEKPVCEHGGRLKPVSPYKYPVFQAGPRVCLGKEMAFIQMKYVVACVLSRFEIRAVKEEEPAFVALLTAHMAGGLKVLVKGRNSNNNNNNE